MSAAQTALRSPLWIALTLLDGRDNTTPNAEGIMTQLMAEAGFAKVVETKVIATPTGSIPLYRTRNGGDDFGVHA